MPILVGHHSLDKKLSVFLLGRKIYSINGAKWPVVQGVVIVESYPKHLVIGVQVECLFHYKSPIGIMQDKILYFETKILSQSNGNSCESDGKTRCPFIFDLGTKSLPPSFYFNVSEWHDVNMPFGISWRLIGFLAMPSQQAFSLDDFKIMSKATVPFQIAYNYSDDLLRIQPNYRKEVAAVSSNFALFKPNVELVISLSDPIYSQTKPIEIALSLNNSTSSYRIQHLRINLKQKLIVQHSNVKFRYKKTALIFSKTPGNPYVHPAGNILKYDLNLNVPKKSTLAQVYPLGNKRGDDTRNSLLLSSTCFSNASSGLANFDCTYQLELFATVLDESLFGKALEFSAKIPLVVSCPILDNDGDLSSEEFLPIVATVLEDISFCKSGIGILIDNWDRYRSESARSDRMVTESPEHASVLEEMMISFQQQLSIFQEHFKNPLLPKKDIYGWPKDPIPFNMFLLELELLVRAIPSPPSYSPTSDAISMPLESPIRHLLGHSQNFVSMAESVVKTWIQPEIIDSIDQSICDLMDQENKHIMEELDNISRGLDQESVLHRPEKI